MNKYDLIVIGGGSGGLVCAVGGVGLGAKVALIEKHKLGGDCLNTGCVPSKALIKSAKVIHTIKEHKKYGISNASCEFSFSDIMQRVKDVQVVIEPHDSPERFRGLGVDVKFGEYRFTGPHELTNGEETLYGKRIVIATGSAPAVPPIPGLAESTHYTSDTIWGLTELPHRLLVIGGGPIGSELSQCFARLGSQVTLIQTHNGILLREDADMRAYVQRAFEKDGIQFKFSAAIKSVSGTSPATVTFEIDEREESVEADAILVATGRRPNIKGLNLEGIGVSTTRSGVDVNAYCETSVPTIYACGDVAGSYQFTHFADYQAKVVLRNALFPGRSKANYRVVPWCTYTDPEIARVGISEEEANEQGIQYDVYSYDLKDLDRAICDSNAEGKVKVITKKGSDAILGAAIVGPDAGNMISEFSVAMKQNLGLKAILNTIHPYPSMGEMAKRVSSVWMNSRFKPWMKRLFTWYFRTVLR